MYICMQKGTRVGEKLQQRTEKALSARSSEFAKWKIDGPLSHRIEKRLTSVVILLFFFFFFFSCILLLFYAITSSDLKDKVSSG